MCFFFLPEMSPGPEVVLSKRGLEHFAITTGVQAKFSFTCQNQVGSWNVRPFSTEKNMDGQVKKLKYRLYDDANR